MQHRKKDSHSHFLIPDSLVLWVTGLILLTLIVFFPGLQSAFIFDDFLAIVKNPAIQQPPSIHSLLDFESETPLSGRPLVSFSFIINYKLFGLNPYGFKFTNLCIHIFNAILAFRIAKNILRISHLGDNANVTPFLIATAWAIHPINSEAVLYATQRTVLLSSFFSLGSILFCFSSIESKQKTLYTLLSSFSCALAVLCKESAIIIPIVIILIDRTFLFESFSNAFRNRKYLYIGLMTSWIIAAPIILEGPRSNTVGWHLGLSSIQYFSMQLIYIPHYIKLLIWPTTLLLHYPEPDWNNWSTYLWPAIFWTTCIAAFIKIGIRSYINAFPFAACILLLAPTSSFLPIVSEFAAERRMYLSSFILISYLIVSLKNRQRLSTVLMLIAIAALSIRTSIRALDYRSPISLWENALSHNPNDPVTLSSLGDVHFANGNHKEALEFYERTFEQGSGPISSLINTARILLNPNKPELKNIEAAHSFAQAAHAIVSDNEKILTRKIKLDTISLLAETSLAVGKFEEARMLCNLGISINEAEGSTYNLKLLMSTLEAAEKAFESSQLP